jgi:hypothetical protein
MLTGGTRLIKMMSDKMVESQKEKQKDMLINTVENIGIIHDKMKDITLNMSYVELSTQQFVVLSKLVYLNKDKIDKSDG